MTIDDYRRTHPMPWKHAHRADRPGTLVVLDATNKEVPLMALLDFVGQITAVIARPAPAQPQPQPQPQPTGNAA